MKEKEAELKEAERELHSRYVDCDFFPKQKNVYLNSDLQKDTVVKEVSYREVPHLNEENIRRISTITNAP